MAVLTTPDDPVLPVSILTASVTAGEDVVVVWRRYERQGDAVVRKDSYEVWPAASMGTEWGSPSPNMPTGS